jgi:endoglucanase
VHYYDPPTFAILSEDASWGKVRTDWGTDADYRELSNNMNMMVTNFYNKGIPVVIGEFGAETKGKDDGAVFRYITAVAEAAYVRGFAPILWDITITEVPERGVFFSRAANRMINPDMEAKFREIMKMARR